MAAAIRSGSGQSTLEVPLAVVQVVLCRSWFAGMRYASTFMGAGIGAGIGLLGSLF